MNNQTISNQVLRNFQDQNAVRQNHSLFGSVQQSIRVEPASPAQLMAATFGMSELVVTEHNFFGQPISQRGESQKPSSTPAKKPWVFVMPQATSQKMAKAA